MAGTVPQMAWRLPQSTASMAAGVTCHSPSPSRTPLNGGPAAVELPANAVLVGPCRFASPGTALPGHQGSSAGLALLILPLAQPDGSLARPDLAPIPPHRGQPVRQWPLGGGRMS